MHGIQLRHNWNTLNHAKFEFSEILEYVIFHQEQFLNCVKCIDAYLSRDMIHFFSIKWYHAFRPFYSWLRFWCVKILAWNYDFYFLTNVLCVRTGMVWIKLLLLFMVLEQNSSRLFTDLCYLKRKPHPVQEHSERRRLWSRKMLSGPHLHT